MKTPLSNRSSPKAGNRLIASLPKYLQRQLLTSCEEIELRVFDVLYEANARAHYIYFPSGSLISLITTLRGGARLEIGTIGDEGMLGAPVALGVDVSPQQALVVGAGGAFRMESSLFRKHYKRDARLKQILDRYIYVLLSQLAQTVACTHFHRVDARLARRLLVTRDCVHSDSFRITHELLANLLGVRRVGITQAAGLLHARGLISYHRGKIIILNAAGLETVACQCYRQSNDVYELALGAKRTLQHCQIGHL